MPKKRLIIFLVLYFATIPIATLGYMFLENWSFIESFYMVVNIVTFGGGNAPAPPSILALLFFASLRLFTVFCMAGVAYSALQTSIFERVDRIAYERTRNAKEKPINIFISYRRADSSGITGRIYDRLSSFFGSSHVFMDIDTIAPGEDFLQIIHSSISSCEIMVAVIGHNWIGVDGEHKKIFNNNDFVRIEIQYALQKNIQIIPILVHGASMPPTSDLPDEIVTLLGLQAIELSNERWNHDIQKLVDSIDLIRERSNK